MPTATCYSVPVYGLKEDEKSYFLDGLLWDVRMYQAALPTAAELGLLPSSILALLPKSASERSRGEEAALTKFFRSIDRTDVPCRPRQPDRSTHPGTRVALATHGSAGHAGDGRTPQDPYPYSWRFHAARRTRKTSGSGILAEPAGRGSPPIDLPWRVGL